MSQSARAVVILSCASFAVFGICLTLPGALLPVLVDHFRVRLVEAGSVLAAQPGAYLIAVLLAGRLIRHLGITSATAIGLATMAAGITAFGLAPSWPLAGVALFVCGLGLGVMEVGVNTVLLDIGGERRANVLNLAHLFFGVGSFATPFFATHAVARGLGWRSSYVLAGALTLIVAGAWLSVRSLAPSAGDAPAHGSAAQPLNRRIVALLALLLAVYVGVETGVGAWLTKYLTSVRNLPIAHAGNVLTLYWLGLTAMRLVLAFVAHWMRDEHLIVGLALVATVSLILALLADATPLVIVAFAVTGMGLSGIFPAVIAVGGRTHPHDVTRVTTSLIAGAGSGGIVIPWLMSAVADRAGVTAGMAFYAAMSAVMLVLALVLLAARPSTSTSTTSSP